MTTFAQSAAGCPPLEGSAGVLATDVIQTVKHAAAHAPRSLQAAPGPSELGTPCRRRLGYRVLDWNPKPNTDTDPWASVQGTSVHAWMAAAYERKNKQQEYARYLIEHRVELPGGITGSCDLYDRATGTVIDWKVTSLNKLRDYRRDGPGPQYKAQANLYALGLQLAGESPRQVAIVFLPRGGRIDGLHVWSEPYDHTVAVDTLNRYEAMRQFHLTIDPERHPERWALLPTADAHCLYCPWFLPGSTDLSQGCPGDPAATRPGDGIETLLPQ